MKIVAVTACPTGIAHTYMAQEAIEKECRNRGYEVKVETQGSMGIENELDKRKLMKRMLLFWQLQWGSMVKNVLKKNKMLVK